MPLDRVNGEVIEGLAGSLHVVIEPRHLAELTQVKVPYQAPGKFRPVTKTRPLFDDAVSHGITAFVRAGAMLPITFDESGLLVQLYPKNNKIAVVMTRRVAGEEKYVVRTYDLPPEVVRLLLERSGKRAREH